jgi:hypothetical protein
MLTGANKMFKRCRTSVNQGTNVSYFQRSRTSPSCCVIEMLLAAAAHSSLQKVSMMGTECTRPLTKVFANMHA